MNFPDLNLDSVQAKVDTGAYRSSIHCSRIKELIEGEEKVLKVWFLDKKHPAYSKEGSVFSSYKVVKVRSSNGEMQMRYMVKTRMKLGRKIFKVEFTLTDRSAMKTPVLLGRKCLKERFLVDVSKSYILSNK